MKYKPGMKGGGTKMTTIVEPIFSVQVSAE